MRRLMFREVKWFDRESQVFTSGSAGASSYTEVLDKKQETGFLLFFFFFSSARGSVIPLSLGPQLPSPVCAAQAWASVTRAASFPPKLL